MAWSGASFLGAVIEFCLADVAVIATAGFGRFDSDAGKQELFGLTALVDDPGGKQTFGDETTVALLH